MGYTKSKNAMQKQLNKELDESNEIFSKIGRAGMYLGNKYPISVGHFILVKVYDKDIARAEAFDAETSEKDEKVAYAMIFGKDLEQVENELDYDKEEIDRSADEILERTRYWK